MQICFGEPRTGDSAPCDPCANIQMVDLGGQKSYSNAEEGFPQQPFTQQCWGRDFQMSGRYSRVFICPARQQEKEVCYHLLHLCAEVIQLMEDVLCLRSKRVKPLHPAFKQALGSSFPRVAKHPKCSQKRSDTQRQIFSWCKLALETLRDLLACAKWGHALLSLGKWTGGWVAINPLSQSSGNVWHQCPANLWPRGAEGNIRVGIASVLCPLTPNPGRNSDGGLSLPGKTISQTG